MPIGAFKLNLIAKSATVTAVVEILRSKKGITAVNTIPLDVDQSKFGGSSILCGGGDIRVVDSAFAFGTGNFTIECWARPTSVANKGVFHLSDSILPAKSGNSLAVSFNTSWTIYANNTGYSSSTNSPSINNWYHLALVRNSGVTKLYSNGVEVFSQADTYSYSTTTSLCIGGYWNYSFLMNGHIDEFRVSNIARYTAAFTAPTAAFTNDDNTVLLIHANGTDATTFFEDDNGVRSPCGIVALGNAQIDTAQSKFGGTSALFDGTGDYLIINSTDLLSTNSGTIEFWFRFNTNTTSWILSQGNGSTQLDGSLDIRWSNIDGNFTARCIGNATDCVYYIGTTISGTWRHVAFVKDGSNLKLFINGALVVTQSYTGNFGSSQNIYLGTRHSGTGTYNGHLDEIRLSNIARYTTTFTSPAAPFVNDANTVLLIHADGTDATTVFRDDNGMQGAAAKTLTVNGNAQLSTAQAKFGSSSLLLDGNGDYLTVTNAHDLNFQKNDFTIEAWVRFDVLATSNRHTLISNGVASFTTGWIKFAAADLGAAYYPQVVGYDYSSGGTPLMTSSTAVSNNTWYHLAWVRSSLSHYLYLNGALVASNTNGTAQGINVNMNLNGTQIGRYSFDNGTPPSATYMDGYIDEMRISNIARYTTGFTPSTTAFTPDANTLFLSHFEGTNASTTIVDSGGRSQKGITAMGNAQIDTAQSQFGGASALFDGTEDYLIISPNPLPTSGNFTVECWFRPNIINTLKPIWSNRDTAGTNRGVLYINTTGQLTWWNGSSNLNYLSTLSTNTWYHIAAVMDGGTRRLFVNGTGMVTDSASYTAGDVFQIGKADYTSSTITDEISGHIDEFRISNTARYTAAFTPSTKSFQNDDNTVLLLHMDGTDASTVFFDDNGQKPKTA